MGFRIINCYKIISLLVVVVDFFENNAPTSSTGIGSNAINVSC